MAITIDTLKAATRLREEGGFSARPWTTCSDADRSIGRVRAWGYARETAP